MLDPIFNGLQQVSTQFQLGVGEGQCPNCPKNDKQQPLTLVNGIYDRKFVLAAVIIHTCGCSLKYIRVFLTSLFGITPITRAFQNWQIEIDLLAYQINRETIAPVIRDGQTEGKYTPVFTTVIINSKYRTFFHIEVNTGSQTNRIIVEANLKKVSHHELQIVVGDGFPSYLGAVTQELSDTIFIWDLVHEVRGVRKKKPVKNCWKH